MIRFLLSGLALLFLSHSFTCATQATVENKEPTRTAQGINLTSLTADVRPPQYERHSRQRIIPVSAGGNVHVLPDMVSTCCWENLIEERHRA